MSVDPAACPLAELTQHIRDTHHAYLRGELPGIWELLREARGTSADADLRRFVRIFGLFRSTLDSHLRKEEDVLFPFIEGLERSVGIGGKVPTHRFGPLSRPIEILEAEHALGDALLDRLRPLWQRWATSGDPSAWGARLHARMRRLEADMQRHVHLEDAVLFPRTIQLEARPWPASALR